MDLATIIGIALAVFSLLFSVVLEGGHLVSLINIPAAVIVIGGTLGATMTCFSLRDAMKLPSWLSVALKDKKIDSAEIIRVVVTLAETARREGILKLENMLEEIDNDFLRQGVTLVVDGTDYEITKNILRTELDLMQERHQTGIKFFEAAGGYAPTMGIIGTVMGLVHVLGKLSDTGNLGSLIATAFIATFYGVSSANIFWLPIAAKLKARNNQESIAREIIIEGVLAIQAGESPRIIEDRLKSFLPPVERNKMDEQAVLA
ncbi:MAG: flagellar motor protein [Firmicutes bacterium]|nr:flagellar motor protein [Bacillota bacterium]